MVVPEGNLTSNVSSNVTVSVNVIEKVNPIYVLTVAVLVDPILKVIV